MRFVFVPSAPGERGLLTLGNALAPGEYAVSNAQLVTRAMALCAAAGRPVATPSQAREILGIGA